MIHNDCPERENNPLRAVALMGPTASGKSALAMMLAKETGESIVCCDSMQVYQGLDIGTAKPALEERQTVPHAMVDCCALPDVFSAERWAKGALAWIRNENTSGRIPLIVGGAGLYLRALTTGLARIPPEKPDVRARLQARLISGGIEALYAELARVDAASARHLHATDTQRIVRALSVHESTGRPLSAWLNDSRRNQAINRTATSSGDSAPCQDLTPPWSIHCPVFVLDTPREVLQQRIAQRFYAMLEAGWLDEVRRLASLRLADSHPAMRAVGYRQLLTHVRGEWSLEDAVRAGITATRRYAKRQRTWFSHQTKDAVWGDVDMLKSQIYNALTSAIHE